MAVWPVCHLLPDCHIHHTVTCNSWAASKTTGLSLMRYNENRQQMVYCGKQFVISLSSSSSFTCNYSVWCFDHWDLLQIPLKSPHYLYIQVPSFVSSALEITVGHLLIFSSHPLPYWGESCPNTADLFPLNWRVVFSCTGGAIIWQVVTVYNHIISATNIVYSTIQWMLSF